MFRAQFIGNLGKDAEVKNFDNGSTVISFSVAVTEKWTDKSGNSQEKTDWVSCSMWRNEGSSTKIANYLTKGQKVYIEGKPSARGYQTNDGSIAAVLDVRVEDVVLLGSVPQQSQQQQPATNTSAPSPKPVPAQTPQMPVQTNFNSASSDEDLPF